MLESFWDRMRSRKLVEWTIAYLAAGFAVLQLADFLKDAFNWPTVVLRVLTVVVAFGFMAALTVAWYHGEKGHQRAPTTEIALLTLITASTIAISWYVAATTPPETSAATAASPPAAETRFALNDPATAPQSVAVLPFVNMTPDNQNDYLTDGITEDIITEMGKIRGLRVISRTSVMRYKESNKNIREIASELGVGMVLEGSVRVQGDQVRIVAQLIDASTDAHVWAETYDRSLADILAVQSEVSRAIAQALNTQLLPSSLASNTDAPRQVDPDAYRMFQKAKAMANTTDEDERSVAVALLDSAIAKDPDFAQAWSARFNLQMPGGMDAVMAAELPPAPDSILVSRTSVTVMDDVPNQVEARTSLKMMRAIRTRDVDAAEQAAREAIESNPNSVPDRIRHAQILFTRGRAEEALSEMRAAVSLDPMSPVVHAQMGEYMVAAGHTGDADRFLRRAVELDSTSVAARLALGSHLADRGRFDEAITELQAAERLSPGNPGILAPLGYAYARAGREADARRITTQLERTGGRRGVQTGIAQIYAGLGDTEHAAEWLRKGAGVNGAGNGYVFFTPRMRQQFEQMRKLPGMARLLDSLNVRFEFRGPSDSLRPEPPTPPGAGSRSGGRR